jgi:hypothetical protein
MRADQITQQIQQITKGIKALQESLDQLSTSERLEDEKHRLVSECLWPELIVDLKSSVDNMRIFLWNYLESCAPHPNGTATDYAIQAYRMRRATEMLEMLNRATLKASVPEVRSFFERIENIAHVAMEKYENSQAATPKPATN